VVFAIALAEMPALNRFLAPFIAVANLLPKVALIPLFILWLGIGSSSKIGFVAVSVFFIVFYNVLAQCTRANVDVRNHLRVIGSGRWRLITELLLPTAWGALISSLRLSVAFSVFGAVLTEMMASNEGMGYLLANGQATLQPDQVVAAVIVVSTVAMIIDSLLVRLNHRLAAWRQA
jgi:NitT/TauT family transport system permease protein